MNIKGNVALSRRGFALVSVAALLAASAAVADQSFPSKPITFVVGTSAGGPSDAMARVLADAINRTSSHNVIVENKPGASGAIGADVVRRAKPDGYTLGYGFKGQMTNAPLLNDTLKYSIRDDFKTVAITAYPGPVFLLAKAGLGLDTFAEFAKRAKAKPDDLTFATTGPGVADAVAADALNHFSSLKTLQVAYPSNGESVAAAASGHTELAAASYLTFKPFLDSKDLVPLVVFSEKRDEMLPDVPTILEVGMAGFEPDISAWVPWFTVVAPKDTPDEIVAKLNDLIKTALKDEAVRQRYTATGTYLPVMDQIPAAAHEELVSRAESWVKLVKDFGHVK